MESTEKQGNGIATAGLTTGATALGLIAANSGLLGNLLGGNNRPPLEPPATQRDLAYERKLTERDAEIGQLKAQIYTDEKINELRRELTAATAAQQAFNSTISTTVATTVQQTQNLQGLLKGITGIYINQPTMAASEAVFNALKPATSTTAAANG